jgi:hypothetical protein
VVLSIPETDHAKCMSLIQETVAEDWLRSQIFKGVTVGVALRGHPLVVLQTNGRPRRAAPYSYAQIM